MKENRTRKITVIPAKIRTDKRVAIYCRVSTHKDSQEESLEAQKSRLQQVVQNTPGWTLYKIYEDQDSGNDIFRMGFQSMMMDAWDRCFDMILVKSVSRFSRNLEKSKERCNELKSLGIEVIFEEQNLSTFEDEENFELELCMAIAQEESKALSEAIKWGHSKRAKSGESGLYKRRCFGYRKDEYGDLMVNEVDAAIVRRVFDLYLKGYSVDMIMKDLAAHHINSPTGKEKWPKRSIQHMLTNEKYIGNVILGKTYTGEFPNNKQKINHGEQNQFIVKESHPPIISKEMF